MIRILLSTRLGERRWSQADLARATGIRPSTINDLYHEIAERVNLEHLDLICEALEDMTGDRRPLTAWAIVSAPENWRMRRHYSAAAWAREQYTDRWNDCPYFRDMVERGEIPAAYIGRRTVMIHAPIKGTVLLTEGYHFTVDDEEGRQYL